MLLYLFATLSSLFIPLACYTTPPDVPQQHHIVPSYYYYTISPQQHPPLQPRQTFCNIPFSQQGKPVLQPQHQSKGLQAATPQTFNATFQASNKTPQTSNKENFPFPPPQHNCVAPQCLYKNGNLQTAPQEADKENVLPLCPQNNYIMLQQLHKELNLLKTRVDNTTLISQQFDAKNDDLLKVNDKLKGENQALKEKNKSLSKQINILFFQIAKLQHEKSNLERKQNNQINSSYTVSAERDQPTQANNLTTTAGTKRKRPPLSTGAEHEIISRPTRQKKCLMTILNYEKFKEHNFKEHK